MVTQVTKIATRPSFTVIVSDGCYRDSISGHDGETVQDVLARRFAHIGGALPAGWTVQVIRNGWRVR